MSRREPLPSGFGLAAQANDVAHVLDELGWGPTIVECNSAGGPVGQQLAVRRSELVTGLVLAVTFHRSDPTVNRVLQRWIELARRRGWSDLHWDSIVRTFRPATVRRYRLLRPLLRFLPPPKDPDRFVHLLEALLDFDHRPLLPHIGCPALVIGGEDDRVIPATLQREMAALLPRSELVLYPGYGHGADQENPDYERRVDDFAARLGGELSLMRGERG